MRKSMDKIFDSNIIPQESILCKIAPELLQAISKFLLPTDIVHLSHTCKELHQKLPFYLIKSGKVSSQLISGCSPNILFEGPGIHFPVSEINISVTGNDPRVRFKCAFWMQIIRGGKVVQESQKLHCVRSKTFTKKCPAVKEYKPGDKIWFMFCIPLVNYDAFSKLPCHYGAYIYYKVSLQLENYEFGKPIYVSKKRRGYAEFTSPSIVREPKITYPNHEG